MEAYLSADRYFLIYLQGQPNYFTDIQEFSDSLVQVPYEKVIYFLLRSIFPFSSKSDFKKGRGEQTCTFKVSTKLIQNWVELRVNSNFLLCG